MEIVLLDNPMETQFRVVGSAFLHDRQGDNFRVGQIHAINTVAESNPVRCGFRVEVVNDAIENQEQLVGREVAFGHSSRGVAG